MGAESSRFYPLSVVTECEPFLVVFRDDLVDLLKLDPLARCLRTYPDAFALTPMRSHLPRYVRIYDEFFDVQETFVIE